MRKFIDIDGKEYIYQPPKEPVQEAIKELNRIADKECPSFELPKPAQEKPEHSTLNSEHTHEATLTEKHVDEMAERNFKPEQPDKVLCQEMIEQEDGSFKKGKVEEVALPPFPKLPEQPEWEKTFRRVWFDGEEHHYSVERHEKMGEELIGLIRSLLREKNAEVEDGMLEAVEQDKYLTKREKENFSKFIFWFFNQL